MRTWFAGSGGSSRNCATPRLERGASWPGSPVENPGSSSIGSMVRGRRLGSRSRLNREVHVGSCEGRGETPPATRRRLVSNGLHKQPLRHSRWAARWPPAAGLARPSGTAGPGAPTRSDDRVEAPQDRTQAGLGGPDPGVEDDLALLVDDGARDLRPHDGAERALAIRASSSRPAISLRRTVPPASPFASVRSASRARWC